MDIGKAVAAMSKQTRRRLSDNIVKAHQRACETGQRDLADSLREALFAKATGVGSDRTDRRRNPDDIDRALARPQSAFN
jgi:hypothetical protein